MKLIEGTLLQGGRYKIVKSLGQGGFGVTYLGVQSGLERKVAIKEFFMKELCERDESTSHVTLGTEGSRETVNRFREKFLKEARNIAKLNHPNIVRIIDVFEENGTAYYVMEYAEMGSLADKVKRDGYLTEPVATRYIIQIAEALDYIHQQKMNHLDVKPANIMLNEKDEAVLIDFGLSKQYDAVTGNQTSTTPVGISHGYAPMEQYKEGGVQDFSPETDIYALGATFFKLLTGITPPSATDIMEDGLPLQDLKAKGVSTEAIAAISKAMEPRKRDRIKNVRLFIDGLKVVANRASESKSSDVENEATMLIPSKHESDNEATLLNLEQPGAENEGKGAEARIKAELAEAHETADRVIKEEMRIADRTTQKTESNKTWLWVAFGVVVIIGIIIGINLTGNKNSNNEIPEQTSTIEASYDNGTLTVNNVNYDMVKVENGTFTMGATSEMPEWYPDEKPTHKVTLTKDFMIGKTEVTMSLWKAVMGNTPRNYSPNKPVVFVSWYDCQKFITKINQATGREFRLPTEAQWEYAARGGKQSNHTQFSGSNQYEKVAWNVKNSGGFSHDVATKAPNELGIYDMSGNVWEWCADMYNDYYGSDQVDPLVKTPGGSVYTDLKIKARVIRGGAFNYGSDKGRVSCRSHDIPEYGNKMTGFRIVLSE